VAHVVLLWFFGSVWSVLIVKFVLRWQVPKLRLIAISVGLAGLFIMPGGEGGLPVPRSLGEWMAFIGRLVWAGATAGMRLKSRVPPLPAAVVFALGATLTSLAFAPFLESLPTNAATDAVCIGITVLAAGGVWWGLSIAALMWATLRLDPARVGIFLMLEVIFGALTAAIFAGETLSVREMIGGGLVILCGLLEVWPTKADAGHLHVSKNAPYTEMNLDCCLWSRLLQDARHEWGSLSLPRHARDFWFSNARSISSAMICSQS
jgi:drug/metabolite transporter (DMT)-like permease